MGSIINTRPLGGTASIINTRPLGGTASIIKIPSSGRGPPRLLPIAGGGEHPLFSTPLRGVSNPTCLQQDPVLWTGSTAPPAHCGWGDHPLFSTPLRGVSNPTCLQQDPVLW